MLCLYMVINLRHGEYASKCMHLLSSTWDWSSFDAVSLLRVSRDKLFHQAFEPAGDVYRRDSIDQSHYPIFHQMEGKAF